MRGQNRLIIIVVVCLSLGYLFWRQYHLPFAKLAEEIQAIKAAGEPTSYEEIVPPVPSSLNAATVYQQAIKALPKFSEDEQMILDNFSAGRPTDETKVRRLLQRCRKVFELTKQASQLPHARWVKLQPYPYNTEFQHISPLWSLMRLLRTKALLHIQDGEAEKALEECITLLRMAQHLDEEPFGIHVQSIILAFKFTSDVVQCAYSSKDILPQQTRQLLQLVSAWDGDRTLVRLLQLELVLLMQSFDYLRSSPESAREASLSWSEECVVYSGGNIAGWMQPLERQLAINKLIVLRFKRRLLEIARKGEPYDWEAFKKLDEFAQRVKTTGIVFRYPSWLRGFAFRPLAMAGDILWPGGLRFERILPETASTFEEIATAKAYQRLMQTALALSLYRREHGSYPKSLSALVPRFLPDLTKDPFDGKPLRYRCEGQGFKVWSVGSDLKDENGAPRKWLDGDICLSVRL